MRVLPKPATGASQLSCPATSPPVPMSPLVRGRVVSLTILDGRQTLKVQL